MTLHPSRSQDVPLEERAEIAMQEAVDEVLTEHARLGLPIHIWRDGKVVEIHPVEFAKLIASVQDKTDKRRIGTR